MNIRINKIGLLTKMCTFVSVIKNLINLLTNLIFTRMKQLYATIAVVAAALTGGSVTALAAQQQVTPEGFVYNISDAGTASLFTILPGMPGASVTELTIPDVINCNGVDYPVTALEANCLKGHASIKKLVLGKNVTEVGDYALQGCMSLSEVQFDDALKTIGNMSFYQCTSLGNLTFNEGLETIGSYTFWQNQPVKSVYIPASVKKIGANPWGECSAMEKVEVDPANTSYVVIDGVLFDINVETLICLPCAKYFIETGMVYTVPSTVKVLLNNCMRANPFMIEYVLPEGLETIGAQAFLGCSNLTKLNIPSTVTSIGNDVFLLLPKLTSFSVAEGNKKYRSENGMFLTADNSELIYCLIASPDVVVPEGVKSIRTKCFQQKSALVNVTLPSTLQSIGANSFTGCENLEKVTFNAGLQTIGDNAFANCKKLVGADLTGVRTIGAQAFAQCDMLTDVKFGPMLLSLGRLAFNNCWNIRSIELPGTIAMFGTGVFSNCQRMTTIKLGEGLSEIPEGCFTANLLLEEITIPSSVKKIGRDAFNYNMNLKRVTFNEGLKSIGGGAFTTCDLLKVELPSTVTEIGDLSFSNNVNMESFVAGSNLKTIGSGAFVNNVLLQSAALNDGLESIGADAFSGTGLTEVVIPASVKSIGKNVFDLCDELVFIEDRAETPQTRTEDILGEESYDYVELRVPAASVEAYKAADIWSKFSNIVPLSSGVEDIESIGEVRITDIYDINGVRLDAPAPGLNIIRTSDGKVRKVMVR